MYNTICLNSYSIGLRCIFIYSPTLLGLYFRLCGPSNLGLLTLSFFGSYLCIRVFFGLVDLFLRLYSRKRNLCGPSIKNGAFMIRDSWKVARVLWPWYLTILSHRSVTVEWENTSHSTICQPHQWCVKFVSAWFVCKWYKVNRDGYHPNCNTTTIISNYYISIFTMDEDSKIIAI